jgi:hypothetical protein
VIRRVFRHTFTILSALSLLLCVAACVLWARSYWEKDFFEWVQRVGDERPQRVRAIWSGRGVIGFTAAYFTDNFVPPKPWHFVWNSEPVGGWARPSGSALRWLGFGHQSAARPDQGYQDVFVPHGFIALVLAALPLTRLVSLWRLRQRLTHRLCRACGYDLRAHSGGERCPECATPVQSVA